MELQKKSTLNAGSMFEEAKSFGFVPIPIHPIHGKRPLLKDWESFTVKDYEWLYPRYKDHIGNVGIVTGEASNIIVLDIDMHDQGMDEWQKLVKIHGEPLTPKVQSGSGGFHYYFKYEERVKHFKSGSKVVKNEKGIGVGIDIKNARSQVIYPGSIHPGCDPEKKNMKHKCGTTEINQFCRYLGLTYKWLISPNDTPISSIPDWLFEILQLNYEKKNFKKEKKHTKNVQEPCDKPFVQDFTDEAVIELVCNLSIQRSKNYDSWLHLIWCLKKLSNKTDKFQELAREFSKVCPEKFNEDEFIAKWNEGNDSIGWTFSSLLNWLSEDISKEKYQEYCTKYSLDNRIIISYLNDDDEGLAELFVRYFNGIMKIVDGKGNGYIWDHEKRIWNKSFVVECKHIIRTILKPILDNLIISIQDNPTYDEKQKEEKQAFVRKILQKKILSSYGLSGVFQSVHYKIIDVLFESKLNVNNLDEIPILNGNLINLKTSNIRTRTIKDLFTFECPVTYLGDDHLCENAERFFSQVFVRNKELIDYVQRLFGYSMTGHVSDKSFYILWGDGNNGKTTLMEIMRDILSNFYAPCDKEIFIKQERSRGRDAASPSMMVLKGKRLSSCVETEDGKALDEPQVKMLTGGDNFTARELYKTSESFKCIAKLMMLTNAPPSYNTLAAAMQSRIKLVPFFAVFSKDPDLGDCNHFLIDEQFIDDLRTQNLSEVFTVLAKGAKRWYENGLAYPEVCRLELQKQNENLDYLQQFIDQMCLTGSVDAREKTSDFHRAYKMWCDKWRYPNMNPKDIKIHMAKKGYNVAKIGGLEYYKKIMLDSTKNSN